MQSVLPRVITNSYNAMLPHSLLHLTSYLCIASKIKKYQAIRIVEQQNHLSFKSCFSAFSFLTRSPIKCLRVSSPSQIIVHLKIRRILCVSIFCFLTIQVVIYTVQIWSRFTILGQKGFKKERKGFNKTILGQKGSRNNHLFNVLWERLRD